MALGNIEKISTREEFVSFVRDLHADLVEESKGWRSTNYWQNSELEPYLETMAFWIENRMDDYFQRNAEEMPQPSWRLFAEIMFAAAIYE